MIKALVIAPYKGLEEIVKDVAPEIKGFDLHIVQGNLQEGLEFALHAEENGFDLIISRGGTSSLIEKHVRIPVVDIQEYGYDILRILTLVKGFTGKAGIVGFPNITRGAATISSLLDIQVRTLTISHEVEVEEKLRELKQDGFEVVIGDVITTEAAKKIGLNGILITSGKEAVLEAIEEARRVYQLFSSLSKDISFYKTLVDSDHRGITIIDESGVVEFKNEQLRKDFLESNLVDFPDVQLILEKTREEKKEQEQSILIQDELWKISSVPIQGKIALYAERILSSQLNQENQEGYKAIEILPKVPFIPITGGSDSTQKVLRQIEQCGDMDGPVWIMSEAGNGKELIARSIYLSRDETHHPFVLIHCHLLSDKQLKELIKDGFFQGIETSVYLRNVDCLSKSSQQILFTLINQLSKNQMGPKWIASSSANIDEEIDAGHFDRDLYYALARFKIFHLPLRERKMDIKNLIQLFISENHSKYGKQVVGVREDALEELLEYDWPGNVDQLKQMIEQLVQETESYYIKRDQVSNMLHLSEKDYRTVATTNNISLDGTLEEIEKQIIQQVLDEENMNQSKAAERLGINRTTLWRKLK